MSDLDLIARSLRQQKQDLDEMLDQTLTRGTQAAELVEQIEHLRRRSEETLRKFRETERARDEGEDGS